MNYFKIMGVILVVVLFVAITNVTARPYRIKRVSDQRLAELETLLALSKYKGRLVTVPIGFGRVDPWKIGRRRRSSDSLVERPSLDQDSEITDLDLLSSRPREYMPSGHGFVF